MELNRWIGSFLILFGVIFGSYHFIEWQIGHSAAKHLTKSEIKKYKEEKQPNHVLPEPTIQRQVPSAELPFTLGEKVALLIIPKISQKYSVYWGADKNTLKKGVGMYVSQETTAPDGVGHTVLSGHRDTVFIRLGELMIGDLLKLEYGDYLYTYKIKKIWITEPDDQTVIIKKETSTLTLTTCYPFNFIGNAPKRYIVQAKLFYKQDVNPTLNKRRI
ncbi:class D sortase [Bacillus sp. EB600]|uniref:class D sortase n=1 Tax=Bacillus sp. EB600 TaxID=2806345 RepID=UPI00210BA338|nr:class D sortase [Bacillus sp. EB600]MCQ6281301.1 class D sortase [Bacillus sp. EB600]